MPRFGDCRRVSWTISKPELMPWHPHLWQPTAQVATSPEPLQERSARGCELELSDGWRLIDAISSWWVTLHGHAEPAIAAAVLLGQLRWVAWPHSHWGDASVEHREQHALRQLDQALETPTAAVILELLIQGASGMRVV
jgi:adenosylmethionine-8-amino-7-oxononanoate aminotransferase